MKKILIDIGHPAHIHYFKNCANILSTKGYDFFFTVRERDSTIELIKNLGFNYMPRPKGGHNFITKLVALPKTDILLLSIAKSYKPDMLLGFSSPYLAYVARRMHIPYIALDDTEHAPFEHALAWPFASVVLSPSCFYAKLNKKQLLFNAYLELLYLHPHYFTPDNSVYQDLGLNENDKYCILRFVSWEANHDNGQHGLTLYDKETIVQSLSQYCRVFISSEQRLPQSLESFRLKIHPSRLHDALSFSSLYIGEGSTTASESCVLGIPSIYVNTLSVGYCNDEERYGLLYKDMELDNILRIAKSILSNNQSSSIFQERRQKLLNDKIDPTAFLVWFIENWPNSLKIMREDPDYQYRFK